MARFRSGTLERSVKRWGRFPRFGGGSNLKRKQHSWQYVEANEETIPLNSDTLQIILFDEQDWAIPAVAAGSNVRNASFDLCFGVAYTPQDSTLEYDSIALHWGIFALDNDDSTVAISGLFGTHRALKWDQKAWNIAEIPTENGPPEHPRSWNWRVRFRQRFLRFDEQIQFAIAFQSAVSNVISDCRLFIFGRISWEVP